MKFVKFQQKDFRRLFSRDLSRKQFIKNLNNFSNLILLQDCEEVMTDNNKKLITKCKFILLLIK